MTYATDDNESSQVDAEEVFPFLPIEEIERIKCYGRHEQLPKGQVLYSRDCNEFDFFLLLDGTVNTYHQGSPGDSEDDRIVTTYESRQFTGELSLLNRQKSLVDAITQTACSVVRLNQAQLRQMIASEPDVARIVIRAFILRRLRYIRLGLGTVIVAGPSSSRDVVRIRTFLERNEYPVRHIDSDQPAGIDSLQPYNVRPGVQWPAVICRPGSYMENPTIEEIASCLGIAEAIGDDEVFDVAVVGAGPAGLAAAVYAASEGLTTVVVEEMAPGGQAGTSSMIENYLGFPMGISGHELASRAQTQSRKFGARFALPRRVERLDCVGSPYTMQLRGGERVKAHSIIIATGAHYRRLDLPELHRYEGTGVHYAATALEGSFCGDDEICVVGGANSAGQAAVFLSQFADHVHMLVRGDSLSDSMSQYLLNRIEASPKISVHLHTVITELVGEGHLEAVRWTNTRSGQSHTHRTSNAFLMLGAVPNTDFLNGCLALDSNGFVLVGNDVDAAQLRDGWRPAAMESSVPRIFAVGDVRSGSVKRVASAVGSGAVVVSQVHSALTVKRKAG
ncbi:FAD-dependent oxidoreductase [Streptomyces parvulus]|uniref:FAD-dependent oxidoreductase n=1 Tax=Streptomyces parvulus TaxID=146923 RepID=UPI0038062E0F